MQKKEHDFQIRHVHTHTGSFLMNPLREPDRPPQQPVHLAAIASSSLTALADMLWLGPHQKTQRKVVMAKTSCRHVRAPAILHGYFRIHTKEQVSVHLDKNSRVSSSIRKKTLPNPGHSPAPGPALQPLFPRHLAIGLFLPTALGFCLCKVPIHGIEKLLGLLVCPVRVDDGCEQGQPEKEQCQVGWVQAAGEGVPVAEAHPPHVVGEDHPAVEHVDHQPLVDLPDQGV